MNIGKLIGSSLMVVGTMVGAGMLALPLVSAHFSLYFTSAILIAMWVIMVTSALLILEVNLAFPIYANSLGTMAAGTLGKIGQIVSWICTLLLLYSLTAGYISGNASLLAGMIKTIFKVDISNEISAIVFLLIMGGMVFWSTEAVDLFNRFFIGLKGIFLLLTVSLLIPQIDYVNLARSHHEGKLILQLLPIFITALGFHPIIPSLANYIGAKPKELKIVIIFGSGLALVIYLLWLLSTIGVMSWDGANGFAAIQQHDGQIQVKDFVASISTLLNDRWFTLGINGFYSFAMTTSFLGVSLSLFDFLADGFRRSNSHWGRFQSALLTFILPLIFAMFFPNGFILALKYAALFSTILAVILPALMAYRLRLDQKLTSPYRVFGGRFVLMAVLVFGVVMILVEIAALL